MILGVIVQSGGFVSNGPVGPNTVGGTAPAPPSLWLVSAVGLSILAILLVLFMLWR